MVSNNKIEVDHDKVRQAKQPTTTTLRKLVKIRPILICLYVSQDVEYVRQYDDNLSNRVFGCSPCPVFDGETTTGK